MSMGPLVDVRFPAADAQRIRFGLERWGKSLSSFEAPFTDTLRLLESHMARTFDTEGAIGASGKWRPLSPRYKRWKDRYFPGQQVLVRTGALRMSLTHQGHPAGIRHADATSMVFGTTLRWGRYHQAPTKDGRPPRRPLFDWQADARDKSSVAGAVTQIFQAHVIYQRDLATEGNNPIHPSRTLSRLRGTVLH